MRIRQNLPVLFLLLMVTAGLFTMHTTGHTDMPGTTGGHAVSGHGQPLSGTVAGHGVPPMAEPETPAVAFGSAPSGEQMPGMLMAACVAILCGAIAAAFALYLLRRRSRPSALPVWQSAPRARMSRGPPGIRIGLMIADLSVARN